ncbi:MAG: YdaS family helix-turn-helix protein [Hyphomicrobium sp.]
MEALISWLDTERGRRVRLAAHLRIGPSALSQWTRVPAERVQEVADFTGILPHQLRPDVFQGPLIEKGAAA